MRLTRFSTGPDTALRNRWRTAKTRGMFAQLIAFIGVSAVVICTPGPDTALTVRNAFSGGRRCGVWTAAGVATGQAVWTLAASLGIAGLLQASEPAFLVMKVAGAGYLVFLGVQSLGAAWLGRGHAAGSSASSLRLTPARALRQGIVNDLANPKMAAFFLSLLPQFAPRVGGAFAAFPSRGRGRCSAAPRSGAPWTRSPGASLSHSAPAWPFSSGNAAAWREPGDFTEGRYRTNIF
jgi:threonine/homoserine/homoserine lactone efflux protein